MRQVDASKNNLCMCIQIWCFLGVLFSSTFVFGTGLSPECKKEVKYDITNENNTFNCSTLCDSNNVSYNPVVCDTECAKCKESIIDAQKAEAKRKEAEKDEARWEEAKRNYIIIGISLGIAIGILAIVVILLRNRIKKCWIKCPWTGRPSQGERVIDQNDGTIAQGERLIEQNDGTGGTNSSTRKPGTGAANC